MGGKFRTHDADFDEEAVVDRDLQHTSVLGHTVANFKENIIAVSLLCSKPGHNLAWCGGHRYWSTRYDVTKIGRSGIGGLKACVLSAQLQPRSCIYEYRI
jgi:hypothetical protein